MAGNSAANVPFSAVLRLRSGFRRILHPNQHLERQFRKRHWLGNLLELRFGVCRRAPRITWLRSALNPNSRSPDKLLGDTPRSEPQTELRLKERFLALRIVAGLAAGAHFQF